MSIADGILPEQPDFAPHDERLAGAAVSRRERVRRAAVRVARPLVTLLLAYYLVCLGLLVAYRFLDPPITGVQLQRRIEAAIAREEYAPRRNAIEYARLPEHVPRAVVAAEDGRFWTHWGFDFGEMRAAGAGVLQGQRPRGASTITQQLMKNLFGTTHRNPLRKVYDLALTVPAELILPKERILGLYLNNVEWGPGVYGVDAAARHHYGVAVTNLSRAQAAGLAALLPNPLRRTPANTAEYRSAILRRMAFRGW